MLDFKIVKVDEIPYFYQEKECSRDPADIGKAMDEVFQSVWDFMENKGITTTGKALSVYYTYDPDKMTFQSGFSVMPEAEKSAGPDVRFGRTPAGEVLHFRHEGPYEKLKDSYADMLAYAEQEGLNIGAPTWEI